MSERAMMAHLRDLTPDPHNARAHTERGVGMLEAALREVGAARSIVVDEHGVILAGNATVEAAAAAGIDRVRFVEADGNELIAVVRSGLDAHQKRRLALYDNRVAELASWDTGVLQDTFDQDPKARDGLWSDAETDHLLRRERAAKLAKVDPAVDQAEELRQRWDVRPGRSWTIEGRHRVGCGNEYTMPGRAQVTQVPLVCTLVQRDVALAVLTAWTTRALVFGAEAWQSSLRVWWDAAWAGVWVHETPREPSARRQPLVQHTPFGLYLRGRNTRTAWKRPEPGFSSVVHTEASYTDADFGAGVSSEPFAALLAGFDPEVVDTVGDPWAGTLPVLLACEANTRTFVGMEGDPLALAVGLQRCQDAGLEVQHADG